MPIHATLAAACRRLIPRPPAAAVPDRQAEYEARIAHLWRERCYFKELLAESQAKLAAVRAALDPPEAEDEADE